MFAVTLHSTAPKFFWREGQNLKQSYIFLWGEKIVVKVLKPLINLMLKTKK